MTEIKTMFLLLTVIIVGLAIFGFMTPDENKKSTFKCICIIFVMYIFVSTAFKVNIKDNIRLDIKNYRSFKSQTYDIESEIIKSSQNNLKNKLCDLLSSESIKFKDLECKIEYKDNEITHINVTLYNCTEKIKAENLIKDFFEGNGDVNIEFD
ncbi:MAG: hypothetical protein PUB76_03075 [Oscillospiraceae bacterium]|nr:hypothetical protein [Oscillospiraceae bacterium]